MIREAGEGAAMPPRARGRRSVNRARSARVSPRAAAVVCGIALYSARGRTQEREPAAAEPAAVAPESVAPAQPPIGTAATPLGSPPQAQPSAPTEEEVQGSM